MPISPYLANLFLWEFDQATISNKVAMVCYADDLIFFAERRAKCEEIHSFCVDQLAAIGLSIDPIGHGKTIIAEPKAPVEFLGVSLDRLDSNHVANVPSKRINDFKSELVSLGDLDTLLERKL